MSRMQHPHLASWPWTRYAGSRIIEDDDVLLQRSFTRRNVANSWATAMKYPPANQP